MSGWSTIASLCTAGGTLVLAIATFASVRSANRAARATEESLQTRLRPLLVPSRLEDPPEKVGFQDQKWVRVPGGGAIAEVGPDAIYLAMSLRNVGNGIAVLDRWAAFPGRLQGDVGHDPPENFRRLTRDLYVPPSDRGFWQGTMREPSDPAFAELRDVIQDRQPFTIDVLYADYDGGQRMVSRFSIMPHSGDDGWLCSSSRHWNLDRAEPR